MGSTVSVHDNDQDHTVDWKDGWCYTHRNFCNLAEDKPDE